MIFVFKSNLFGVSQVNLLLHVLTCLVTALSRPKGPLYTHRDTPLLFGYAADNNDEPIPYTAYIENAKTCKTTPTQYSDV